MSMELGLSPRSGFTSSSGKAGPSPSGRSTIEFLDPGVRAYAFTFG